MLMFFNLDESGHSLGIRKSTDILKIDLASDVTKPASSKQRQHCAVSSLFKMLFQPSRK